jgi:hypothetical protein
VCFSEKKSSKRSLSYSNNVPFRNRQLAYHHYPCPFIIRLVFFFKIAPIGLLKPFLDAVGASDCGRYDDDDDDGAPVCVALFVVRIVGTAAG